MNLYIKEWPDKTATLIADGGQFLFTFKSLKDAKTACREWYQQQETERDFLEVISEDPSTAACGIN